MDRSTHLVVAMADQCRQLIQADHPEAADLPCELRPAHLLWMCDRIRDHAADWPSTKLHRWIGFVQAAMIANRLLDLAGAKSMFDSVKAAHGGVAPDQDLIDHLDPASSFQIDLGGQG
jgi:hypothetical protein